MDDQEDIVLGSEGNKIVDVLSQLLTESRLNRQRQEACQFQLLGENSNTHIDHPYAWSSHPRGAEGGWHRPEGTVFIPGPDAAR